MSKISESMRDGDSRHNLKSAEKSEVYIGSLLENFYGFRVDYYNSDNKYDIHCYNKSLGCDVTFEVKDDYRSYETGNIPIEFNSWGKPSGILLTKADFHVMRMFESDGSCNNYLIHTDNIRHGIKSGDCRKYQSKKTDSKNWLYLFKVKSFLSYKTIKKMKDFSKKTIDKWEEWFYNSMQMNEEGVVLNPFKI